MTEENTTRATRHERQKRHDEAGLCHVGSKTESACWRPATQKWWAQDEEPTLCPEHLVCSELGMEADEWRLSLDKIDEWIKGPVSEANSDGLQQLAFNVRDEARRQYARLAIETEAAHVVAQAGPDDSPIPLEVQVELSRCILYADALIDARAVFEELPEELLKVRDKWLVVDALADAAGWAGAEAERYKRDHKL